MNPCPRRQLDRTLVTIANKSEESALIGRAFAKYSTPRTFFFRFVLNSFIVLVYFIILPVEKEALHCIEHII